MKDSTSPDIAVVIAALAALFAVVLAACGNEDAGLSRAEVEEIMQEEIAEGAEPQQ